LVDTSTTPADIGKMKPIISPNVRIRYPDHFGIEQFSIVDDYCYFSTRVKIGFCSHIGNNCSVGGGPERLFSLGDFSSLSAGVRVWCTSNDFTSDLVAIIPSAIGEIQDNPIVGDVIFGNYTGAGANSVIMPDNTVPEGTTIGALSYVPSRFPFDPWTVYAGAPVRRVAARNREKVLAQVALIRQRLDEVMKNS
jgi:acetyltransferase-like isoleucine patch superfamily enzyme